MGLFGGTSTTTSHETTSSGPSDFQKPYLTGLFDAAQGAFNSQTGTPYYQGSTYAGMSDQGKAALDAMRSYASGTGLGTANTLSSIGTNLAGYAGKSGQTLDQYLAMANEDPTAANMSAASRYADNPYLQSQIDAVGADVRRNLTENVLPGVDRAASAGGNINSSRAGIASGIAMRGAQDQMAQTAAQMRGEAWDKGLGYARDDRAQRLNAYGTAADAYGNLGSTGMRAMSDGVNAGYGAFDEMNNAEQLGQKDNQGYLDQDFQKWQGNDTRQWDLLNRYNSIVAGNQWGSNSTTDSKTTKPTGGILGGILGGISSAIGIGKSLGISDPRTKKNIERIDTLPDGLGVYSWSYNWEPDSAYNVGVMADEVASIRPWALGPEVHGYQTVNYENL